MLQMRDITKSYEKHGRSVLALDKVTTEVNPGDFVSVIGPSGSGKTTLLLTIGGLARPSSGEILVNGSSVYSLSAKERALLRLRMIGFVFQTFNLLPYLSALENVCVPLALSGKTRREQKCRGTDLLVRMGLESRLTHLPGELSVGECQRVALSRALANQPSILLADEPTGNLDPECTDDIIRYFEDLHGDGMTIIMVTHDHDAAQRASRQLCLREGRLLQVSSREKENIT